MRPIVTPRIGADPAAFGIACGMAFLAGATDVCGLSRLHDMFVSFMSGNTTLLAFALGNGDFRRAVAIAWLVALFVAGAFLGTIVAVLSGRRHRVAVTLAVAALLLLAACWPRVTIAALVLAMGGLNAAMQRAGATGVSLTYVTGTLVKFAQGLARTVCGQPSDPSWPLQGVLWLALLAGAAFGTLGVNWLGGRMLFGLSLRALGLAGAAALRPERGGEEAASVRAAQA